MSIGHKGMLQAAKVMAITAVELALDPALIEKAKADFVEDNRGRAIYGAAAGRRRSAEAGQGESRVTLP